MYTARPSFFPFPYPARHLGWALCSSPGERQVNNSERGVFEVCVLGECGWQGCLTLQPQSRRGSGKMLQVLGPSSSLLGLWGPSGKPRGDRPPISTQPPAVSASELQSCRKAVKGEVRRGTCPRGTPDFGSGFRGIEKRDGASMEGRRLEPRSRQKRGEAAKWAPTASGAHLSPCLLSRVLPALRPDGS